MQVISVDKTKERQKVWKNMWLFHIVLTCFIITVNLPCFDENQPKFYWMTVDVNYLEDLNTYIYICLLYTSDAADE